MISLLILAALVAPKAPGALMIIHGPVMPYIASTATFDGTNDRMLRTSAPTGLANSKTLTFSCWIKSGADSGTHIMLGFGTTSAERMYFEVNADGQAGVFGTNAAGTTICVLYSTTTVTVAKGWMHLYFCIDLTDSAKCKIYVNGVVESSYAFSTPLTNDTLAYTTGGRYAVGDITRTALTVPLNGSLSELWFDDTYLDDPTKFRAGGHPISLGSDGSLPTGSAPVFYFKGSGNAFNVNSGTGGDFTITGSLDTTTPP